MTLIACTAGTPFGAISDIAISNGAAANRPLALPMRGNRQVELGNSVSGALRKALLRNNTLLMWAGQQVVATELFARILEASADGRHTIDLARVVENSGLNPKEKEACSIICCHADPATINIQSHQTYRNSVFGEDLIFSGTGLWDFFNNTQPQVTGVAGFHFRAVLNLMIEMTRDDILNYHYGGWYELFGADATGLVPMPYAVKFWTIEKGAVWFGNPLVFSWYEENTLCVANIEGFTSPQENTSIHVIGDILNLTDLTEPPALRWEPSIVFHVVHHRERDQVRVKWERAPDQSVTMVRADNGTRFEFKKAVLNEFLSADFWEVDLDHRVNKNLY